MNKITLSIGIPVHNESANIAYLLNTIFKQNVQNFSLENVFVVCDGTTDNSDIIAKKIAKKHKKLIVINDKKHKGKMNRLMEMYKMNKSDFIAIFDGDIVLGNAHVLENMVKQFTKDTVIVGANNQPLPTKEFVGKLVNTWSTIWYYTRKSYKAGDNIHCIRGCGMMLKRSFAKSVRFPKGLISDAQYLYFYQYFKGFKFKFADNAIVYYKKPTTLRDYLSQSKRTKSENKKLARIFNKSVIDLYKIPRRYSVKSFIYKLAKDPLYTLLSALFTYGVKFIPVKKEKTGTGWKRISSTKTGISMVTF